MTYEDEVLFQRYHILGYDIDAHSMCDSAAAANDDNPGPGDNQGLVGDTQGHSND